jgi:xanthine dehydrogenase accessory factor
MKQTWDLAARSVAKGLSTILVTVVEHTGSVPGTTGASMVVSELGCAGTVGGGIAEHQLIERARGFDGRAELIDIVHTQDGVGSLCSGKHTIAIASLGRDDLPVLEMITATLAGEGYGTLTITESGPTFQPNTGTPTRFDRSPHEWCFETTVGNLDTLYIVGGGHVALALSRVMVTLPFRVVVLDDRTDLPTMDANSFAHEKHVVDYPSIAGHIADGDRSWVVVMTFGHAHDASVIEALTGKPLRYLGLMGSAAKVSRMFRSFRDGGISEDHIGRISAPVGLSIGSHTPEEIAISIAAEIVKMRNRK